ncbi:carbohydrate esterase family 8 protein [Desarmillaria tabescens]|uniref:Pectinesterase n=1 Tax=Armillaria tabescens TaxID=1929756 RepID=A0AA39JJ56_ARMTA|nr:carbohydrate esterase family 8 protein [Desarmillaria tabescens]KAK0442721.1 carbohydrate esterase family 8 protein [Desarmillaria tabescens]
MVFPSLKALALFSFIALLTGLVHATPAVKRDSRTSAPSGAVVVRASGASSGEYSTVQAAVDSLADDGTDQVIFIYAGTYTEQVYIDRDGQTTIMGQTSDTSSYESNTVTITYSLSLADADDDDSTGTLRVHKDDFALYNVNVKNTFGKASTNGQALALSAYGTNHGYYGVGFYGYQDTVLAETGNQFYGYCYIEGAVDYIFGQYARAYFHYNRIASVGAGAITANGRSSSDGVSLYVINKATITTSSSATSSIEGKVYLGRPWGEYARVVYTSCSLGNLINSAGWEEWSSSEPNTDHVTFAEYGSTGSGASGTRASFATTLTSTSGYTISDVLGSDYADWVDSDYL